MKIRAQRATLAESMQMVREIEPNLQAVFDYLVDMGYSFRSPIQVMLTPYGRDERIGWDTYLVTLGGEAVAFTDSTFDFQLKADHLTVT